MSKDKIHLSKPSLAPLSEYMEILGTAWESGILTHHGPLVQQLERELAKRFNLNNIVVLVNGTIALQFAVKALELSGEIITTPFTWIATTSAIQWEGCTPVYADIDPHTFNIDPEKIEACITDKTVAIMPVHVFSNACDIEAIDRIAKRNNLKVIYDAAHASFTNFKGKSILEYGDISATSFHATKLFNTGEGGACFTNSPELHERLKQLRFYGQNAKKEIVSTGTNGKMTEVHAALGLANLKYMDTVLTNRRKLYLRYQTNLESLSWIRFQKYDSESYNFSYFPIVLESEELLLAVAQTLKDHGIITRRYFYPSLNTVESVMPYLSMPVSEDISRRILILPLYNTLQQEEVDSISEIIHSVNVKC